jgi:H+/gluconate symporter-like permease
METITLLAGTTSIFDNISTDLISGFIASIATIVTGYIVIRERILKSEIKLENVYDYIDGRNELLDSKIKELQEDISDFKEINKEASKSLSENTVAIRELKFVLTILQEQLGANNHSLKKNIKRDSIE